MSQRPGPSIPGAYRSGPVPGSGSVSRVPQGYKYYPKEVLPPWVKEQPQEGERPKQVGGFKAWIRRNPKKFHNIGICLGLLIFFSRPLYDAFLRESIEGPQPARLPSETKRPFT